MFKTLLLVTALILTYSHTVLAKVRGTAEQAGIYSKILSEQRDLLIQLPNSYHLNPKKTYPVLYLTDGLRNFNHASGTLDLLHQSEHAPEMIIVAIKNTHRTRDFTPTYDESYNRWGVSGGADNFLDFIEKELIPYINNRYRSNGFKVLSGHSLGGLLSIYTLQTRPNLFQAHFAFSPSLWWHDGIVLKQAEQFYKQNSPLNNYLYLNLADETGHMLSSFERYQQLLGEQKRTGFNFGLDFIKHEDHGTSAMVGLNTAYRGLLKQFTCQHVDYSQGLNSVDKCYQALSQKFNAQLSPTYLAYRAVAANAITNKRYAEAASIYEHLIGQFPYITDAYFRLAYLYEGRGDDNKALDTINSALKVSVIENVENNKIKTFKTHIQSKLPKQTCKTVKKYDQHGKESCAL